MKKALKRVGRKRKSKSRGKNVLFLVPVAVFFLFFSLYAMFFSTHSKSGQKFLAVNAIAQEHLPLIITATPTPTLTPTPTPTPEPTGFCVNVPVLMYHHIDAWEHAVSAGHTALTVDAGVFDQQMSYLKAQGYTFYFARDLVSALKNHTQLSGKPIVITIDDGYDDVYAYAYPVLRKYGIKATLFIPTGLLGNTAGTNSYYTWGQVKDMVGSGFLSAENHTWSHAPMGISGEAKDQFELNTAETQIEQSLGSHSSVFAYPYGTNAGDTAVWSELQKDGFLGAFSTIGGTYQCDSFIYSLHRTRIGSLNFPAFGIF